MKQTKKNIQIEHHCSDFFFEKYHLRKAKDKIEPSFRIFVEWVLSISLCSSLRLILLHFRNEFNYINYFEFSLINPHLHIVSFNQERFPINQECDLCNLLLFMFPKTRLAFFFSFQNIFLRVISLLLTWIFFYFFYCGKNHVT